MSDVGGVGGRVGGREYARRVNAAAELLAAGVPPAEAARVLAGRFGCSVRQARRYAERATAGGPAVVPEETMVFTVKLPAALAARCGRGSRAARSPSWWRRRCPSFWRPGTES